MSWGSEQRVRVLTPCGLTLSHRRPSLLFTHPLSPASVFSNLPNLSHPLSLPNLHLSSIPGRVILLSLLVSRHKSFKWCQGFELDPLVKRWPKPSDGREVNTATFCLSVLLVWTNSPPFLYITHWFVGCITEALEASQSLGSSREKRRVSPLVDSNLAAFLLPCSWQHYLQQPRCENNLNVINR